MNALAVLIIYGNCAVIFHPPKLGFRKVTGLPRPIAIHDAFLMTGMFNSYVTYNLDFLVWGRRDDTGLEADRERWIQLHRDDFYPHRLGITFTQMWVAHQWDIHGKKLQRKGWAVQAKKIRLRHNRLYPTRQIERVRLGMITWPMSTRGYEALRKPGRTKTQHWFTEGRPRGRRSR